MFFAAEKEFMLGSTLALIKRDRDLPWPSSSIVLSFLPLYLCWNTGFTLNRRLSLVFDASCTVWMLACERLPDAPRLFKLC
jgi:hypothetical protein